MNKIGRNDLCLCGSGKKYKKCCLNSVSATDSKYRRQRQIEADVTGRLLEYATNTFGDPNLVRDTWDTFNGVDGVALPDPDSPINLVFIPWLLFSCEFENAGRAADSKVTIAEAFWLVHEDKLADDEISFLDAAAGVPFSLCEVLEFKPLVGMRLRDLFTREEFEVVDRASTLDLDTGDIIYCAIIEMDEMKSALAISPFPLAPSAKKVILELRKEITDFVERDKLTGMDLAEFDSEIRSLYFELLHEMLSPPAILNSDDEAFLPQKVYFDLRSVDESYHRLKDLAGADSQERLPERATIEDGRIVRAEIPWAGGNAEAIERFGNPVLLGVLKLSDGGLIAEVNSTERAERIRTIIEERLGDTAIYKSTVIEEIDLPFTDIWPGKPAAARASAGLSGKDIIGSS